MAGDTHGTRRFQHATEIDAPVARVFAFWSRFEDLPRILGGVRRTKCIDERRVLWDADISGYQVVWEAEILECVPEKRIRWRSCWGASNAGEIGFEALSATRTLVTLDLRYQPATPLERLGARLGLVGRQIRRDLDRFRDFVAGLPTAVDTPQPRR